MFRYLSAHSTTRNRVSTVDSKPVLNKLKSSDAALLPLDKKKHSNDNAVPWKTLFSHSAFWAASIAQYSGANAYFTMFRLVRDSSFLGHFTLTLPTF